MLMVLLCRSSCCPWRGRWLRAVTTPTWILHHVEQEAFYMLEEGRSVRVVADAALRYAGVEPRKNLSGLSWGARWQQRD